MVRLFFLILSLLTYFIWVTNEYSPLLAFTIYPIIFMYLIFKKKPISDFIVVILFSVMSVKAKTGIYKIDYILTSCLFLYVIYINIKNRTVNIGYLFLPLIIYFFYNVLSLIWTPDKRIGFEGVVAIFEGYMMYYIVTNGKFKVIKADLIKVSKLASLILITLTLEIITRYAEVGLDKILSDKDFITLGWGTSNLIGAIYVLLIPVLLCKYFYKMDKLKWYLTIDSISIIGLFLTFSRGAYIGSITSLIIFLLIKINKKNILKYGIRLGVIIIGCVILFYIICLYNKNLIFTIINYAINDSDRFSLYKLGWESFLDNPIFGTGVKSSEILINTQLLRKEAHYHNFILQIASTLGIVGLLLFGYIVRGWIKILYQPKEPFIDMIAISLVGALTHQLFDVSFDLHYFGIYFYLLLGLVEIYRHHKEDDYLNMKSITF